LPDDEEQAQANQQEIDIPIRTGTQRSIIGAPRFFAVLRLEFKLDFHDALWNASGLPGKL
jgi:hypothetical protein